MTRVQTQYDKAGGFQARFRQESRLKAAGASDSAVGWMYFKKPSRMRWQYETRRNRRDRLRRPAGVDVHARRRLSHGL